jgi:uncharacterized damage-inducible protein DinB
MTDQRESSDTERQEFIGALAKHRGLLVRTVRGISEEQARLRPTVSVLCLGGLIKHVTTMEQGWANFITEGTSAMGGVDATDVTRFSATFEMMDDETVALLLERYRERAKATDELVMKLPSLGVSHPLPDAPSARRVLMHVIAETAQHAGHADIIRETIDGAKSMG